MAQPTLEMAPDGRPAFPSHWEVLDIALDELNLAHTLPVGQTFLWHRQPIRKDADSSVLAALPDARPDVDAYKTPATVRETVRAVTQTETVVDERMHDAKVKIEEIKEEVLIRVKTEDHDPIRVLHERQESVKEEQEMQDLDAEPLEEWSRAIRNPPRVIFLRQTPTKIYYTSIVPPSTQPPHPELPTDSCTIGNPETDRAFLVDLFNIELTARFGSLGEIYTRWAEQDPLLFGRAMKTRAVPQGVRVLRQDPWECLIEFITSSANNVPRITSLMHRLCYHFSPLLLTLPAPGYSTQPETEGDIVPYISYHLFPRPIDLLHRSVPAEKEEGADVDEKSLIDRLQQTLRELGFGYRAGFISSALQTLVAAHGTPEERSLLGLPRSMHDGEMGDGGVEAFLMSLRQGRVSVGDVGGSENESTQRWRAELLRLKGVGRKVADCIGLMSLDQANIVPIDTHLQQIAARHPRFPAKLRSKATSTEGAYNAVQTFLCDLWGGGPEETSSEQGARPRMELAGWCQSVMFAADLKGSTAVVNIKVEVLKQEGTLVKLEYAGESQTSSDPDMKPLDKKRRRRPAARQLETPDTVSVISDLLPDNKWLSTAQSATAAGAQVKKTDAQILAGKRKRASAGDNASAKVVVKRVKGPLKSKAKPAQASSVMATNSAVPASPAADSGTLGDIRRTSRRTERYASRCDKLEVETPADP
ncbi:hypothetical protein QFC21_003066 [Naganishia friedmannii]|uniref:Uncharacterized protein n=1 Tax=Naganishia friedmannii TaxID=89922 RepID=A0ACC2VS50_9TREE|nr:hypothetical protein QFC21_003066 [Naganishia friedmannii]